MSPSPRLVLVGVLLLVSAGGLVAQQQQAAPATQAAAVLPIVIDGRVPQPDPIAAQAGLQATVIVRVTTDGAGVSAVDIVRAATMFTERVVDAVKTWRFLEHTPTSFETTVNFPFRYPEPVCFNSDDNTHWELTLPQRVDVRPVKGVLCERSSNWSGSVSRLRGRLYCDCPGRPPVSGAHLTARSLQGGRDDIDATTDKDGWFDFGQLPDRGYHVSISAARFFDHSFFVRIVPNDAPRELDLLLDLDTKTVAPPPAIATAGRVPVYPEDARKSGVEGVVGLRVAPDASVTVISGPPTLAAAALANIRTWTFEQRPRRAFDVAYRYFLVPGDCDPNQNPRVTMELPMAVEVIAKRPVGCSDSGSPRGSIPAVVDADIPQAAQFWQQAGVEGKARLRITTDGVAVRTVEVLEADKHMEIVAPNHVRFWRFAPHAPTTFETVVRYLKTAMTSCEDRTPYGDMRFVGRLPSDITMVYGGVFTCDPQNEYPRSTRRFAPVRSIRGTLRCDCPSAAPIVNARLSAYLPLRGTGAAATSGSATTDEYGRFAFEPLPPGRYEITAWDAAGFASQLFEADVSANASEGTLDLSLKPDPRYRPQTPLAPWFRAGKVPEYPVELRRAGVEGSVHLRVGGDGAVTVVEGPTALAAAATANVRTWQFYRSDGGVADVRYRYRLVPGDCGADQNPTVIVRDDEVEIIAKRPVSCR